MPTRPNASNLEIEPLTGALDAEVRAERSAVRIHPETRARKSSIAKPA